MILTSIIVIAVIAAVTLFIVRNVQKGKNTLTELKKDLNNNPEIQAQVDMFKELYNKDLRPVVAKKAPKKEKTVKEVETIAEVVTPEVVEKVVEVAKVTPETATVNVEAVVEEVKKETKPEFPIDKPKKKRKYYPKKK